MSTAISLHPVLAELETRAGASDEDRPAWLAERLGGCTATEVRDLVILGPSFRRILKARKLGRLPDVADLSRVPVIGWGKDREKVIADNLQERYAIAPETRVFRAADNPRFLASPDGVGVAFDGTLVTSEVKTAGHDVSVGSPGYAKKGYELQQQWVMRVTGARRSMFAWEERVEVIPGVFEPGEITYEWVEYDEQIVSQLEAIALEFLAEVDAAREAGDVEEVVDEDLDTDAVNYLRGLDLEKQGAALKKTAFESIKTRLAGMESFQQVSAIARVTYSETAATDGETADVEAAQAADKELWESLEILREQWAEHLTKFTKPVTVPGKTYLTVTPVKAPKETKK